MRNPFARKDHRPEKSERDEEEKGKGEEIARRVKSDT
jgi:hypothetical protein